MYGLHHCQSKNRKFLNLNEYFVHAGHVLMFRSKEEKSMKLTKYFVTCFNPKFLSNSSRHFLSLSRSKLLTSDQ